MTKLQLLNNSYFWISVEFFKNQDYNNSIKYSILAIENGYEWYMPYYYIWRSYLFMNKYEEAVLYLKKVSEFSDVPSSIMELNKNYINYYRHSFLNYH